MTSFEASIRAPMRLTCVAVLFLNVYFLISLRITILHSDFYSLLSFFPLSSLMPMYFMAFPAAPSQPALFYSTISQLLLCIAMTFMLAMQRWKYRAQSPDKKEDKDRRKPLTMKVDCSLLCEVQTPMWIKWSQASWIGRRWQWSVTAPPDKDRLRRPSQGTLNLWFKA